MPRTAKTPAARASDVRAAIANVDALIARAVSVSETHGYGSPEAIRAWEPVELIGATVHRQARLLAGKSRGG